MVYSAKASHIGGALSMADILAVLYKYTINHDPNNPDWNDRDRVFLSKGHACTSLYATLALCQYFPKRLLEEYGKNGTLLISHASSQIPGVELSTGSLGHALPVACGIALAGKRKKKQYKVYVILSDGELDEGSNWEAFMLASQLKLDNLKVIIDYNKIQSLGRLEEVINLEPLADKFRAFNLNVAEIDGHDHDQIHSAFEKVSENSRPSVIIADTVKGKGIPFMENKLLWHYKSPSEDEYMLGMEYIQGLAK